MLSPLGSRNAVVRLLFSLDNMEQEDLLHSSSKYFVCIYDFWWKKHMGFSAVNVVRHNES